MHSWRSIARSTARTSESTRPWKPPISRYGFTSWLWRRRSQPETSAVLKAISQVKFDAPQGVKVGIFAQNNHISTSSIMAQVNESGNFDILEHYGQIDPIVPGCNLT